MTRTYEKCSRKTTTITTHSLSLLLIAVLFGSGNMLIAQTKISRQQFSRMSVLTRASYFEDEILKAANAEGVDPNILWTIAYLETRFRPWLTSPKNAKGMMQFIPATAERFNLSDPYEPVSAIRAAAKYVKYLSKLFGGRVDSILAAYNSGEGTVSAYLTGKRLSNGQKTINPNRLKTAGGIPPYRETTGYVRHGLTIYRWLIDRQAYPSTVSRTNLTSIISERATSPSMFDREIENAPSFKNFQLRESAKQQQSVPAQPTASKPNAQIKSNLNGLEIPVVFYDPRTGNRYLSKSGEKKRLVDSGNVVISELSRPDTTNIARSISFQGTSKQQ